jgi:enterochelin esterase-like enzyme
MRLIKTSLLGLALASFGSSQTGAPPHGTLERIKVHGKSLEVNLEGDSPDRDVSIYLPPSYAADRTRRYPVVYVLHGYTDSDDRWFGLKQSFINLPAVTDKTLASGTAREMILVMPNAYTAYQGSMYSTSVTTGDWDRFISEDLVSYIDSHYRTIGQVASRGLAGHSMGGYGTIKIGMKHPEVFSSIYILSPCCMIPNLNPQSSTLAKAEAIQSVAEVAQADFGTKAMVASAAAWSANPKKPPLFFDLPVKDGQLQPVIAAKWAANAPLAMIDQYLPNLGKLHAIAVDAGAQDEPIASTVRTLDQMLNQAGIPHTFEIYEGNHVNHIADRVETKVLPFFSSNLSFGPASAPTGALPQNSPTYVQFTPSAVKGALYRPDSGSAPHVGILIMHRTSNFLSHLGATELSKRGFLVLAMNPRSDNNEAAVNWEDNALDVKSGVEYLRKQPGITKVILFGHSGGGPTMSFYQAVAEKGPAYCQGPKKLVECSNSLAGLPRADGIVFVDAHPGNSVNGLRSLNPAVMNEADARKVNPDLDPFNPKNGFNPKGPSTYSEDFKTKYFKAQAERMNRLIDIASEKRRRIDNDVFLIPRGEGARLMELDLSVHHSTMKPQKLLKNDGTIVTQIVESVRRTGRVSEKENGSFDAGTRLLTLRSFLSANAIRATDSMDGIDWCSSNNSTPCALRNISVPILITAMGAHYFIRDNEIHYEVAASADKDFVVIEGATHGIRPCTACETFPGQYSHSVENFADYVQKWISARF